jgi:hypothetical protein
MMLNNIIEVTYSEIMLQSLLCILIGILITIICNSLKEPKTWK